MSGWNRKLQSFSFGALSVRLLVPVMGEAYWAKLWPSAIALSEYIAAKPHLVTDRKVLEIAAGVGLPGIVAAQLASEVTISDYIPEAVDLIKESAALNECSNIECLVIDWNELPEDLEADVLLLSDINYEPAAFEMLYRMLLSFLNRGTTIILSTPQRLMAKPFIELLLPYCVEQEEQRITLNEEIAFISVFVLRQS